MTPEQLAERGIRVKPLEWSGEPEDCCLCAASALGLYVISVEYGDEWFCDFTLNGTAHTRRISGNQDGPVVPQAAAEADHAARIAAQLEGME